MGIASFSPHFSRMAARSVLTSPLQAFLALFIPAGLVAPASCASAARTASCGSAVRGGHPTAHGAGHRDVNAAPAIRAESRTMVKPSRLKIVRQFEPGVAASLAGRMVISGRMADVCAELERMERKESAISQISMF